LPRSSAACQAFPPGLLFFAYSTAPWCHPPRATETLRSSAACVDPSFPADLLYLALAPRDRSGPCTWGKLILLTPLIQFSATRLSSPVPQAPSGVLFWSRPLTSFQHTPSLLFTPSCFHPTRLQTGHLPTTRLGVAHFPPGAVVGLSAHFNPPRLAQVDFTSLSASSLGCSLFDRLCDQ
jgi:hypothetical protein